MNDPVTYGLNEMSEIRHLGPVGQPKGATVVFGGQAGSEGKGAVAGYLARKYRWGAAACNFMTNAGHTWMSNDADKVVVQQIPVGLVSPTVDQLVIGPGAAITLPQLFLELELYDQEFDVARRLRIDRRAMIIEEEDVEYEARTLQYIASTGKGCGAALARKTSRLQTVRLARDVSELKPFLIDSAALLLNDEINSGRGVLVEGAQGFDLDINHGYSYPYCTSRGTTPMHVVADLGIEGRLVTRSIAVVRTRPIRVGNTDAGYSGDYGSKEMSWEEVSGSAGRPITETTTVTKRTRRVFECDFDRLGVMSRICRPTDIALTFADYISKEVYGWTHRDVIANRWPDELMSFIWRVEGAVARGPASPRVRVIKTGPFDSHTWDVCAL